MSGKLIKIRIKLYAGQRLCKNVVLRYYLRIAFVQDIANIAKTLLFVGWPKIQYARDDEGPHVLNLNKNIDDQLYCNSK